MNHCFTKANRLTKKREFKDIFEKGRVFRNNDIVAYILLNNKQNSRLGVIVKKKIGNAVKRNKIKRFFREGFRTNKCHLNYCVDIIIIPGSNTKEITLLLAEEFFRQLCEYINKLNLRQHS